MNKWPVALGSSGCTHNPYGCGCIKAYRRMMRELKELREIRDRFDDLVKGA